MSHPKPREATHLLTPGMRHRMQRPSDGHVLHSRYFALQPPADCVLRRKAHRQLVTWLAWLAMAFIVVAPLVSRVLPAPAAMQGMMAMLGGDCPHVMADVGHPATPDGAPDSTDRCGYCVLLDHQSLLAAHVILHLLPAPPRAFASTALHDADVRTTPRLSARPRGPPHLA